MKELLLILAMTGAALFYYSTTSSTDASVANYQELLKKAETSTVSRQDVIFGANDLARFQCSQVPTTSSAECVARYSGNQVTCEERVFANAPESYARKEDVSAAAEAFAGCVRGG
ncbi:hypothetical protein [Pseudomonas sp. LRF_L74]|uniref:hypothetical protein n=1 Tax=Pseudomonas sp. LRF_L74 TaxID=3369422 RepID=UPI003F63F9AC